MEGVPQHEFPMERIGDSTDVVTLLAETGIFPSKGEARKMVQSGGVSINKEKIPAIDFKPGTEQLLHNRYLLIQKGKKNYYLVKAV
jgi:tyrosyl-tRNA synthetase